MSHKVPDGVIQNYLDKVDDIDYEYDASVKLMWAQTDYYEQMTELVKEQKVTEKLRQKLLRKHLNNYKSNNFNENKSEEELYDE